MSVEERPKVLMLAYACDPEGTGEHWLGWGWAEQAAQRYRVFLLTTPKARAAVERNAVRQARVLSDLRRARVPGPQDEVLFMELCRIPNAYVIFDAHYESARAEVLSALAAYGVHSCGRWGGWNYGGMEDALLEGRAAAQALSGRTA